MSTLENEGCALLEAPLDALGDDELDEDPEALGDAALGDDELGDEAPDEDELGDEAPDEDELGEDELGDEELGDEELGDEELDAPPDALPDEDLLSVALGLDLLSLALGLELDEAPPLVLCAWATPASANSAAAVAVTTTFKSMVNPPRRFGELQDHFMQ